MNQDRGDIGASLVELIPLLRARFGVKRIGLFGSTARGTHRPTSDSDILVESRECGATFNNFMDLIFFREDTLKKPVDLVTTHSISPYMKQDIEREVLWCEG
jgi:hypothetical protein